MSAMRFLLALAILFCHVAPVRAWNALGHRVIADIAWQRLTPETQNAITETLRRHPRFDEDFAKQMPADMDEDRWIFQQAAVWPDIIRGNQEFDHPTWHYVNFPLFVGGTRPLYGVNLSSAYPPIESQREWNVAQAVKFCIETLEGDATPSDKALAYCWLLHLIGDLHQPMHTTALFSDRFPTGDRGGNSIPVIQGKNLHSLWDNLLGRSHTPNDVKQSVAELENNTVLWHINPTDRVEDWIAEGHDLAKSFAYSSETVTAVEAEGELLSVNLPEPYLKEAGRRARQRVVAAGIRAADAINQLNQPEVVGGTLSWAAPAKFIPQPVNSNGKNLPGGGTVAVGGREEFATVQLSLKNDGSELIKLRRGEWSVDSVESLDAGYSTTLALRRINHDKHLPVEVKSPREGLVVPFDLDVALPPGETFTFVIWLTTDVKAAVVFMEGRVRIVADGQVLESEKLRCELHPFESYYEW